jgi:hypothetical protein
MRDAVSVIVMYVDDFGHRGKAARQRGQERSELGHGALRLLGWCLTHLKLDAIDP